MSYVSSFQNVQPKISVIMPVYNGSRYLCEAIESILKQTYSDFELIIVDDFSTDNTVDLIKEYQAKGGKVVMVGDAETDYQAAMENSIDFIGVSENKKQFPTALAVLGDLTELVSVLCIV